MNRRAILAGAIAATVPVPVLASADPIYAAIEADREAFAAFIARCEFEDDLAEKGIKLKPGANDYRTPEMIAVVNASIATRVSLANTAPTTTAGLAAYLDYVLAMSPDEFHFEDDEAIDFVRSLARYAAAPPTS
jgi:hypothetical protein